jgi:hypothetical protein
MHGTSDYATPSYQHLTAFYEKVIKVKADVAAVLASATQRFGSGGGHCQGRPAGRSS